MTTRDHVTALLDLAGIEPHASEVDELIASFPDLRARVERLWALDIGDTAPALVYRAAGVTGPKDGADV